MPDPSDTTQRYDRVVAQIAGNLLTSTDFVEDSLLKLDQTVVIMKIERAVHLARAIVAETIRTEPAVPLHPCAQLVIDDWPADFGMK